MPHLLSPPRLRIAIKQVLVASVTLSLCYFGMPTTLHAELIAPESLAAAQQALSHGDVTTAGKIYDQLVRQGELLPAELGQVLVALQSGEFRKAMAHANLVAGEHPESSEAGALLALLIDRSGRTEQALSMLSKLESEYANDWQPVAIHADILIDRSVAQQAIELINNWSAKHRDNKPIELQRLLVRAHVANHAEQSITQAKTTSQWSNTWSALAFQSLPIAAADIHAAGNGVVIDHGTTVLTYAKVLRGSSGHAWVRNGVGQVSYAEIEKYVGENNEWVRLRLSQPYPKQWSIEPSQSIAPEAVRFCFVFGFAVPASLDAAYPAITPGLMLRANTGVGGLMQITSAVGAGHDGAPVFDSRGRLLGLALNNGEHEIANQSIRKVLGAGTFVLRADGASGIGLTNAAASSTPLPPMPAVEELFERLSPAVVQIVALK